MVEGCGVVPGQGDDKKCDNVLNDRIWVEGAVLEYEPRCVAKTPGKISTTYQHAGGVTVCQYKGEPVLETVQGRRLRGSNSKKGVDVLAEGGGVLITRRRRDAVSAI